jgi:GNAT superfamily N-acetyltransferase
MAFELLSLDTLIDGANEAKFFAIVEGVCVGCVGLELNGRRSISFRQLFVAEKYRRLGIGRELVRLCEQRAKSAGCETLGAIVAAGNYSVLPFYQRQGFIVAYEYDDGDLLIVKELE